MSVTNDTQFTIDELARHVGMTVRNVRAHQSRGLLPPPEIRGRTGYYGPEHIGRLELIKDLQAEGYSLEVIKRILDRSTYEEPFQYSEGVEHVIVNGQAVIDKGRYTGARPGRALRHRAAKE